MLRTNLSESETRATFDCSQPVLRAPNVPQASVGGKNVDSKTIEIEDFWGGDDFGADVGLRDGSLRGGHGEFKFAEVSESDGRDDKRADDGDDQQHEQDRGDDHGRVRIIFAIFLFRAGISDHAGGRAELHGERNVSSRSGAGIYGQSDVSGAPGIWLVGVVER